MKQPIFGPHCQAYSVMRDRLPADDPGSLVGQAAIHRCLCGLSATDIHSNGLFFLWHRWFLFFHERALASAIGASGQTLPIPYWHGVTTASSPELPIVFGTQSLSADSRLGPPPHNDPADLMGWDLGIVLKSMSGAVVLDQLDQLLYWHSAIHRFLGFVRNRPYMFSPMDAAVDPIFYFFHASVDRLLQFWITSICGTQKQPKASCVVRSAMGNIYDQPFVFWDAATKVWVRVRASAAFLLDHNYDSLPTLGHNFQSVLFLRIRNARLSIPPSGVLIRAYPASGKPTFGGSRAAPISVAHLYSRSVGHHSSGPENVNVTFRFPGPRGVQWRFAAEFFDGPTLRRQEIRNADIFEDSLQNPKLL